MSAISLRTIDQRLQAGKSLERDYASFVTGVKKRRVRSDLSSSQLQTALR
jgi:hypothetical protein